MIDVFALTNHVVADPAEFGFTNVTTACLASEICADPEHYAFWNSIHPTTRLHQVFAEKFAKAINRALVRQHNR
jgi:phospholipase/lecithinase/hemolysin